MSKEDDDALCAAQNRHMEHPLRTDRITLVVRHRSKELKFWRHLLGQSLPTFSDHCLTCKQCGGGLLDDNGEEQGLCDEGFRLWQADLRAGKGL